MADSQRSGLAERDFQQAITALKKGAYLLKYGRRGKPKFSRFQLSNDESMLIWYSGKKEKQLKLSQVSRIIPGQRTAIFQRYPRPEKEYQSFSLIYNDRSLDLICKDKDEAEVWFTGIKALTTRTSSLKWKTDTKSSSTSSDSPHARNKKNSPSISPLQDSGDTQGLQVPLEKASNNGLGKAFADIITYTEPTKSFSKPGSVAFAHSPSSLTSACVDNSEGRNSSAEAFRISLSSVGSSSQGSGREDFDSLGDVFIWGEGINDGILGGGVHRVGKFASPKMDALLPKELESVMVLDVQNIACGGRHAVLVTKQGEIFSWGEESGGRLGHGVEEDAPQPKLIQTLSGMNVELVACGEYHTCAVTFSGDLYTWGDGNHYSGLLGHGSEVSHWIPKKVCGQMVGKHVSYISCGIWHTAVVTSAGQLFTFGDGSFGALGHGDLSSTSIPREVETLEGLRTTRVACGVWHTAAVVEIVAEPSTSPSVRTSSGKLFTWGDGDKGRLGHGDKEPRIFPECVAPLIDESICQVACGYNLTVALTTSGHVYTMGSTAYGQLGSATASGLVPTRVKGKIANCSVVEIACGSYHVAALTSRAEVYTWGKGANGQLGHGDRDDRNSPTLVDFLKDRQVKSVVCGSNFTAIICLHKWASSADQFVCSGCRSQFGFRRKRHNCYNCGLVFCKACSSKKSLKAALAPNLNKPYRVCDDCFSKLKKSTESDSVVRSPRNGNVYHKTFEVADRETQGPRFLTQLSRLSSVYSIKHTEGRLSNLKPELHDNRVYPVTNKNLGRFHSSIVSTPLVEAPKKVLSASFHGSRMTSRTTSHVSRKSSPPLSSEVTLVSRKSSPPRSSDVTLVSRKSSPPHSSGVTLDDSVHMNDNLSQEIMNLRAQVEELTSKSQHLEAELERTSKQLKEATATATDEAEKCKAAKEAIKSLSAQLKEMAERTQGNSPTITHSPSFITDSMAKHTSDVRDMFSSETHKTSIISPENESNGNSVNQIPSHGTKAQTQKAEYVVQHEPGVYITLSSLPGGGNEIKRVRFSRKHFTEQQAEKWWVENGEKVCERHNIQTPA